MFSVTSPFFVSFNSEVSVFGFRTIGRIDEPCLKQIMLDIFWYLSHFMYLMIKEELQ